MAVEGLQSDSFRFYLEKNFELVRKNEKLIQNKCDRFISNTLRQQKILKEHFEKKSSTLIEFGLCWNCPYSPASLQKTVKSLKIVAGTDVFHFNSTESVLRIHFVILRKTFSGDVRFYDF